MLKIKGLKKKKKGKKNKHKEEELFEPEELEAYRREQAAKLEAAKEAALAGEAAPQVQQVGSSPEEGKEDEDEWQKFKLLTSGVDDILKKTQEDLGRIKETSFFQRKPPGPSKPDRPGRPPRPERPPDLKALAAKKEEFSFDLEDLEDSEEDDDEEEDIFDTSYVDLVTSGEVKLKLVYVPDSPTTEEQAGFDPFDTSIVDKVIKAEEEKRKKVLKLSSAVEVLTGKVEKPVSTENSEVRSRPKRRPKAQDLLIGSFDEDSGVPPPAPVEVEVEPPPKSILDEDPVFEEETSATVGFPPVTPLAEVKPITGESEEKTSPKDKEPELDLKQLVEEFIPSFSEPIEDELIPKAPEPEPEPEDDLDDEFAALAAESLSKEQPVVEQQPEQPATEAPTKGKTKPPRPPPPGRPPPPKLGPKAEGPAPVSNFSSPDKEEEEDPFDTSFASQVLPGKFELKLIEKEILDSNILDTNPAVEDKLKALIQNSELSAPLKAVNKETDQDLAVPIERDLLGGSATDLSCIGEEPIQPVSGSSPGHLSYRDPFDTSQVDSLVAPGKTELKFLEKELLDQVGASSNPEPNLSDDEFDPRAEEPAPRPDSLDIAGNKRVSVPKIVAFDVKSPQLPDLLAVEQEEGAKISKPLTPYYAEPSAGALSCNSDVDPFDTSHVTNIPGKVELKLLEDELVGGPIPPIVKSTLTKSLSDPDFDPRGDVDPAAEPVAEPTLPILTRPSVDLTTDILSEDVIAETKLHTPVVPRRIEEDLENQEVEVDPFDTSIADALAPGKAELKLLENELL